MVHNAGAMPKERIETPQGHETQLACHVLGPHLMTERLLPLLRDAHGASVVFMSSGGMYPTAPGHFWHDRAQRPTTFGWQRPEKPEVVAQFLDAVSSMTGTMQFTQNSQEAHRD
mgnify:CR=1 FL=1